MRFKDLSPAAVEHFWEKWHCMIHEMLDEFNEDVFNGGGQIRENTYWESPYLLLETKIGCLYIFPLPADEFALRLFRLRLEKINPTLIAMLSQPGQENFVGGIRVPVKNTDTGSISVQTAFRGNLETGLRFLYSEYWRSLLY